MTGDVEQSTDVRSQLARSTILFNVHNHRHSSFSCWMGMEGSFGISSGSILLLSTTTFYSTVVEVTVVWSRGILVPSSTVVKATGVQDFGCSGGASYHFSVVRRVGPALSFPSSVAFVLLCGKTCASSRGCCSGIAFIRADGTSLFVMSCWCPFSSPTDWLCCYLRDGLVGSLTIYCLAILSMSFLTATS
jgi:hypothetical protein